MKTSKKVLSIFLSLLMVALMLPIAAVPASALEGFGQCGDDIEWAFFSGTGELVLSGTGAMYDYNYDSSAELGSVEKCDSPFYAARDLIKSVKIYDGITTIGSYAFYDCDALKTVTIYDESLTSINRSAFFGCSNLESVTFEGEFNDLTTIGINAFGRDFKLKTFDIPNRVATLGEGALDGIAVTSLTIPAYLRYFNPADLADCPKLTSITVGSGHYDYSSVDGCLYSSGRSTLYLVPAKYGSSIMILSNEVTTFASYAFDACADLTDIYYTGSEEEWAAIANCNKVPDGVTIHYNTPVAVGQCGDNVSYTFYADGRLIVSGTGPMYDAPSYAYSVQSRIKSIEIKNGVTEIGNNAFSFSLLLESVTIPNSVTRIGAFAFDNCDKLESVTTPAGVATIGDYAFRDCTSLETVEILGDPTLGNNVFENCESLKNVTLPGTLTSIGMYMFKNCTSLESFTVPYAVTYIGIYAFENCKFTSISISPQLETITYGVFKDCDNLTDVYYSFTEEMWDDITIGYGNEVLENVTKHFGACKITAQADVGGRLISSASSYLLTGASYTVSARPNNGYAFDGWYIGETKVSGDMEYTFTATRDVNLTARFMAVVNVYAGALPNSSAGTVTGGGAYPLGAEVTVTATPKSGYAFGGWYYGNTLLSEDATYTFTLEDEDTYLYAQFNITDAESLARLNSDGYFQIPTEDSDSLADGDKWFNLDMILSVLEHYPGVFGIEEEDLEATLDTYRNAACFYHYGNETYPSMGDVLVYASGDITWGESIPIDLFPGHSEFNDLMLHYGLKTHGVSLTDGFQLLPTADDATFAEGTYWFDLAGFVADLVGVLDEELLEFEKNSTKFCLSDDGTTLRMIQFDADYIEVTQDDDSAFPGLLAYLHRHVDLLDYQPLPTADSDELVYGAKWLNLASFLTAAPIDGYSEEQIAALENSDYYINTAGTKVKAVKDEIVTVYNQESLLYMFLREHGVALVPGFTLLPQADSESLANGDYYLDVAALVAGAYFEQGVQALLPYYQFYLSADANTIKAVVFDCIVSSAIERGDDDIFNYLHQHYVPQEVFRVDTDTQTAILAEPGVLDETVGLVVEPNALVEPTVTISDGNMTLANVNIAPYEITIVDLEGTPVQPEGSVTVMIPLPEGFDASKIKVYYVDGEGNAVDMGAVVSNGYIIFTADHFSIYVVVDETCLHNGETEVRDAVTGNCHVDGYTGDTYCTICGDKIATGTNTGKDMTKHDGATEVRDAVTGNCHTDGYTGDTWCLGCNTKIASGTNTGKDMTKHDGATEIRGAVTANCHVEGYTGDTWCLGCNTKIATGTNTGKDASKHDGGTEVRNAKAATCKTDGYTGDTYCKGCNNKIASGSTISKDTIAHTRGPIVKENVVNATTEHGGSYDEVVRCTVCNKVLSSTHKTTDKLPSQPQSNPNACKWCGKEHNGFFQKIVAFFHNILASIFGAKY